jgi:CheY-like chemotaxis protein
MASVPPVSKRVLIADPVDKTRQSLAHFLREKGLEVFECADGSKALAETLLRHPEILLLDLSITILGADRLVQILRSNPNTKDTPIFFFSDMEKSVSGFRPGVDEFIRKPYHEEEVLLRLQRSLFEDPLSEALTGDSEISGNLSQIYLPDLWQMLSLNSKSGIIQVEGEKLTGSIYIDKGEIVSASTQNIVGEKALFRLVPLRVGKFRFMPGKVGIRRTIFTPSQHAVLEGMRQFDELQKLGKERPENGDSVVLGANAREVASAGGAVREVLLLAEFCHHVEDIVNNCNLPDLAVYQTLINLKSRGVLKIGNFEAENAKSEFLPPADLAQLRSRLEEKGSFSGGPNGRIVLFLPDSELLESVVMALGQYKEFEIDNVFFSLRRKEGSPIGMFGKIRVGEDSALYLYVFPYIRSTSPLWYSLAPDPVGIVAFLKDEITSSLEGLMAVSDYTRGAKARVVMAVMGKTFTNFGLGENTLRLFQNRIEKLGCVLKVQEMKTLSPEEIRDTLVNVVRQYIEREGGKGTE